MSVDFPLEAAPHFGYNRIRTMRKGGNALKSIETIRRAVSEAALNYPIKRVDLFGSYANGLANEDSDVDFLVEFSESPISLFKISGFQMTLSELLQMEVDIIEAPLAPDSMLTIDRTVCVYGS